MTRWLSLAIMVLCLFAPHAIAQPASTEIPLPHRGTGR
jgi:hypothetical protein